MTALAINGSTPAVRSAHTVGWPPIDDGLRAHVLAALDTRKLGYGPGSQGRRFEEDFARYHGMRHAIACNSGTSALLLAYFAAGLYRSPDAPPPRVIVPAYGFFATVSPLLHLGADPVFCDVDPELGTLDVDAVAAAIDDQTRAIVVTHVAGHPADMPALLRLARPRGISVIEDCSHAHGASLDGRLVGTWGDTAAFSLQTGKMLSGGEGGIVLTDSDTRLIRASMLGNFRRLDGTALEPTAGLTETGLGLKLRISPLSAAMAGYYLARLDDLIAARRVRLDHLSARIHAQAEGWFAPPATRPGASRGAFYEYHVRLLAPDPDGRLLSFVRAALTAEGCLLPHSNTKAIHTLPLFAASLDDAYAAVLGRRPAPRERLSPPPSMPHAERLTASTFTLPTFTFEPLDLVDQYADALAKVAAYLSGHTGRPR